MPRGGRRTGAPGAAYSNRTDLNQNRTLPIQAAPGQPYGQAGAQIAAQRALPLASAPAPAPVAPSAPAAPPVMPGSLTPLTAPTTRPNEPLTAGIDSGPGPGSAVLGLNAGDTLRSLLTSISQSPTATPEVAALLQRLQNGSL
jgi:hypothetical protein